MSTDRTIVVSKIGQSLWARSAVVNPMAEQGCTMGLLSHLAERKDLRVIYMGMVHGELPDGIIHLQPSTEKLSSNVDGDEYQRRLDETFEQLAPYHPRLLLHSMASRSAWCHPRNPCNVSVMMYTLRNSGFGIYAGIHFRIPRICLITDYRAYPTEFEMTTHPITVPRALLSQRDLEYTRTARIKWAYREAYCGAENWIRYGLPHVQFSRGNRRKPVVVLANAQIHGGFNQAHRDDIWRWIFGEDNCYLREVDGVVFGEGWQDYSQYDPALMPGPCHPQEVLQKLSQFTAGVVVPPAFSFTTPKVRLHALAGCWPLFYSNRADPEFTYDCDARYLPLDHPTRILCEGGLVVAAKQAEREDPTELIKKTEPNFETIDSCIDAILNDEATDTEAWWRRFGGMRRIRKARS